MRTLFLPAALASAALLGGAAIASSQTRAERDARDAAALDKALAGLHPAGKSSCLPLFRSSDASLSAVGDKLIYKVSNRLAYVSDTGGGCENVARNDILVTRSNFGRLCSGDIATTVDQGSHVPTGSCALGDFTTWRK